MPGGGVVELHEHALYARTTEPAHTFVRDHRHTTTAVAIRDADWTTQGHVVEASQDGEDGLGRVRESYEHGEGRTLSISSYDEGARRYQQNDAARQKTVRHEAHGVDGVVASGISRVTGFTPGLTFELRGHPTVGVDGQYLLTRVVHVNESLEDGADAYHNRFECIPIGVTYRPKRRTKKPRVASIQTAVVTGPSGEEIHVDEHGRVKVRFHWDRENPADDTSSCWIRCQQAWAGQGWGSWWVPRIGMEVIVQFVDGDPDRPMVTGCVYNGENGTPYSLPDEKTKSTIKSNSSPGGGGFNELRFEDRAGSEQIYAHAQKDYDEEILNDHTTSVGNNQTNTVSVDQTQEIGANQTETVHGNQVMTVDGNRTVHVKSNFDETVDANETRLVNGTVTETIQGSETRTVNGGHTETINAGETRTVNGGQTQTVNGGQTETFNGGHTQTITGGSQISITGSLLQDVSGGVTINTPGTFVVNADAGYTLKTPAGGKVIADGGWTVIAPGGQTQVDSWWDWTGGTWAQSAGIKMSMATLSTSITAISMSATAVSAATVGIGLSRKSLKLENTAVDLRQSSAVLWQKAVSIASCGLYCVT
jgi:type VI secretion system secreted protein VgrG